jgi:hypothetical protein
MVAVLLKSIKNNLAYENQGSCIKLIGHLLYEDNEFESSTLEAIYRDVGKLAFDQPPQAPMQT